ncbi:putative membrane protein [Helicobacter pylori Hp H-44]|nr:putative membrane protein [Helicobacter pylori Hp H-44]
MFFTFLKNGILFYRFRSHFVVKFIFLKFYFIKGNFIFLKR